MFKWISLTSILIAACCIDGLCQPANATWVKIFEDNFDGTTLDQSKWNYNYSWGHTHNHRAYMDEKQVSVSGGTLKLTAINKRHPDAPDGTDKWHDQFGYLSFDYTSGAINTINKFEFTYGYAEGRFKMSSTLGTWPAFWTLNAGGEWPPEIDILEVPSARTTHHYYYHYGPDWQHESSFGGQHNGVDKSAGFHTYGVDWGPNYMDFYFDGSRIASYTGRSETSQGYKMFLILNLAVGGWAGNPPAGAVFPTTFECDYVRVWQKDLSTNSNMGLETGGLGQWGNWNNVQVTNDCSHNGSYGLKLSQSPSSSERLVEVAPNTTYILGGWGKLLSGSPTTLLGVKDFGGNQTTATFTSNAWQNKEITFTTGATATTARIFFYQSSGSGVSCGDDFYLNKATIDCNGTVNGTATIDACGICSGGNTGKQACNRTIVEAETLCDFDGVRENSHAGFTGNAYLNIDNLVGASLGFAIKTDAAKILNLFIRYSNGSANERNCSLAVNGVIQKDIVKFPSTGSDWTKWNETSATLSLSKGLNIIRFLSITDEGAPNFDQFSISGSDKFLPCDTQTISLKQGWNLISINRHPVDSTISTLFKGLDIGEIKNFDSFWRNGQSVLFNSLKGIETGKGYLIKMNTANVLQVKGYAPTDSSIEFTPGKWNLIGCPFIRQTPFSTIPSTANSTIIKNFDGFWKPDYPMNGIQNFEPGAAYFIKKD